MREDAIVFIMAGGVGTRFWPVSQTKYAKQFHKLVDSNRSLIQSTFDRFSQLVSKDRIYVITSSEQVEMTKQHLPELGDHQIIGEPDRKNTGPATMLGSIIAEHVSPGCSCIFTPADATIGDIPAFIDCLNLATDFTSTQDGIVTLGIKPTEAHTGYGYIKYVDGEGAPFRVESFREKPDKETAQRYLESETYLWNAGIFVWRTDYILSVFKELAGEMYDSFRELKFADNDSLDLASLKKVYGHIENESVDYLIMEKAPLVFTIPGDFGWSDIGNWKALYAYLKKDSNGNVIQTDKYILDGVDNSLVRSDSGKLIVIKDLTGYAIVETEKTLLIYPLDQEQDIKKVREQVQEKFGEEFI